MGRGFHDLNSRKEWEKCPVGTIQSKVTPNVLKYEEVSVIPHERLDNFVNLNCSKACDTITWTSTYSPLDNTNNSYNYHQQDYNTEINSMKNL